MLLRRIAPGRLCSAPPAPFPRSVASLTSSSFHSSSSSSSSSSSATRTLPAEEGSRIAPFAAPPPSPEADFSPGNPSRYFGTLPPRVVICEVGPRDGLQNERKDRIVRLEDKFHLITMLEDAGVRRIEAGSFVLAPRVPQMADSGELMQMLMLRRQILKDKQQAQSAAASTASGSSSVSDDPFGPVVYPVLVPNLKGLERAIESGATEIALFAAASEDFSQKNTNMSIEKALERAAEVVQAGASARPDLRFRGYVSTVLGCPYKGVVPIEDVVRVSHRMLDMGAYEISLGDTIGAGTPGKVYELLHALLKSGIPVEKIAVHFHDTYGQALANTLMALQFGVGTVDSSVAGLGGCPFAKGATGNVATEDVVFMLHGMGIETGIDLDKLMEAGRFITRRIGKDPRSNVNTAAMSKGSLPDTYFESLPPGERRRLGLDTDTTQT